jgi:uncharacterized membrane protein YkoI
MESFFADARERTLKASFIRRSASLADNSVVNASRMSAHAKRDATLCRHAGLRAALAALLLAGLAPPPAWASDSRDHERARAAVEAGQVIALPTLLERLKRTHPGQVLELELERDDGRWVYEVKLLQVNGQLVKLEVDAATARVLEVSRKEQRNDGRKNGGKTGREDGRQAKPESDGQVMPSKALPL